MHTTENLVRMARMAAARAHLSREYKEDIVNVRCLQQHMIAQLSRLCDLALLYTWLLQITARCLEYTRDHDYTVARIVL